MKRTILIAALLVPINTVVACDFARSVQRIKDGKWGEYGYAAKHCDYMKDAVIPPCVSPAIVKAHAVRIRFDKTNEVKTFMCDDIRKQRKKG